MISTVAAARETFWDVVVVGTGMGGAVAGFALARGGRSVLFIEKGHARSPSTLSGAYAEEFSRDTRLSGLQDAAVLAAAGRQWESMEDDTGKGPTTFVPFIGAGVGGSSALYGMALERFSPLDFAPRANFAEGHGSALPERWPVTFDELLPFYAEAETLFALRGTPDPTSPNPASGLAAPPPLSATGDELFTSLKKRGLHPYRPPMACEFVENCASCQGYLCSKSCKNDASRMCVEPALAKYGGTLLDRCEVTRISTQDGSVDAIECFRQGEHFRVQARIVVLAAGALGSAAVLLRSTSPAWPHGVANSSGQVGRNLMRHLIDLYAVRPGTRVGLDNRRKELAFNDFYVHGGVKLGSVQSFGRLPPASVIASDLAASVHRATGRLGGRAFSIVTPLLERALKPLVERNVVFAGIVEDLPYGSNRVTVAPGAGLRIHYDVKVEAISRVMLQRRLILDAFRPHSTRLIRQARNNARIAHACGTCRFGDDPRASVLDRNNRCHDVANLYVVDGSFFPSSGGTNPALTIAANALRVARNILRAAR